MIAFRNERTLTLMKDHGLLEPPPHLSPKDGSQTKHATTTTANEKQANEHD